MLKAPPLRRTVAAAFAVVTLLFLAATLFANWMSYDVESHADSITATALPSIVHLTAACDALRELEVNADDYADLSPGARAAAHDAIEREWRVLDTELTSYLSLPSYAGERELYESSVPAALRDVNTLIARLDTPSVPPRPVVAGGSDRDLPLATNRAARLLQRLVLFNAEQAKQEVARIASIHRAAARNSLLLDSLAAAFSVPLALLILGRFRAHDQLLEAHNATLEARANELEMFGQRVAHDLLSPLTSLTYCLAPFKRYADTDPKLKDALGRARLCVTRAQSMVHGVFDFARAGGKPEANARAELLSVVDAVVADLVAEEGESGPQVKVEPFEARAVACTTGVLTSVLSNLLRNAAKFMSDAELKQITVRVIEKPTLVRVEVEDSGPGIPRGLESRIFEPYVRAEGVTQRGLGLGLATVKRLCEAYGGAVGVRSELGRGATFWFTLPRPSAATDSVPPASAAQVREVG